jgi:hypothetical protein
MSTPCSSGAIRSRGNEEEFYEMKREERRVDRRRH